MRKRSPWAWIPTLYFSEGLPFVTVMTITLILYKQMGLSNSQITFYTSWLYLPWLIKPLWSPFLDLTKTKRWWTIAMQLLIGASLGGVAFTIPTAFWLQGSLFFFWTMAFSCAIHDTAANALYRHGLDDESQSSFINVRSAFYRLAVIFGQGVLVMVAGNLQVIYRNSIPFSWSLMFYGVAGLFIALWLWHGYVLPNPPSDKPRSDTTPSAVWIDFMQGAKSFFQKPQAIVAVLFLLIFQMPKGLLTKVSTLFLVDRPSNGGIGLSPQEYGLVQGTVGVIGFTLGIIMGGMAIGRDGMKRWLWAMACTITLPNAVYIYMSYALPTSLAIINTCVLIEQFGYGFGLTAYLLYIIYYSRGEDKSCHYTLCTAFMACSMMLPSLFSGALQEVVGYRGFFIIVMASGIATFAATWFLKVDPDFGKKEKD